MLGHTILSTQRNFLDWKWKQFHEKLLFNFVFYMKMKIEEEGKKKEEEEKGTEERKRREKKERLKVVLCVCLEGPTHQEGPSGSDNIEHETT